VWVTADLTRVTAMALGRAVVPSAVAPADTTAVRRRVAAVWSEPEPWTVAVLLLTSVAIIARHPLAHMLGTAGDDPVVAPSVVATAPATPGAGVPVTAAAAGLAAVPTHAPRDPFRSLVQASGKVLAPEPLSVGRSTAPARTHTAAKGSLTHTARVTATGGTCAGTVHTVVAGESLWSIASTQVGSDNTRTVTIAWRRIYADNRAKVSNPDQLAIGTRLCLPS
jgi:nucleoid-associated protein YgaU